MLETFRQIADIMNPPPASPWEWHGEHLMSQNRYGLSEDTARDLRARYGGECRRSPEAEDMSQLVEAARRRRQARLG